MLTRNVAGVQRERYNPGMGAALGGYIRTLREERGLRQADVLRLLSERYGRAVDRSKYYRLEKGTDKERWPEGDFLAALLDILKANIADIGWIQQHKDATEADGERLAREWLSREEIERIRAFTTTDEGRLRLLQHVYELSDDPELRARIQGYLDGLQSNRSS